MYSHDQLKSHYNQERVTGSLRQKQGLNDLVAMIPTAPIEPLQPEGWMSRWKFRVSNHLDPKPEPEVRKKAPTYQISTEAYDPYELWKDLNTTGHLSRSSMTDLAHGDYEIPPLNQLIVSERATKDILHLVEQGYGIWPVLPDQRAGDINWVALGVRMGLPQQIAVQQAENTRSRNIGGLWIPDKGLTITRALGSGNQLPTLVESALAFGLFQQQEGKFPDTKRSFVTSSAIEVDVETPIKRGLLEKSPNQLLLEVALANSQYERELRGYLPYLETDDDLDMRRKTGGFVRKFQHELKVTGPSGRVDLHIFRDNLVQVRLEDDLTVKSENDKVTFNRRLEYDPYYETSRYKKTEYPLAVVDAEIRNILRPIDGVAKEVHHALLTVGSDPEKGLRIGMHVYDRAGMSAVDVAGGFLQVVAFDKKTYPFEEVPGAQYPNFFPDRLPGTK